MTFLVADDNERMRASIRSYLMTKVPDHHRIYEAIDGGEAIMLFERFHPDWVLMDIMMEPMDGLAASRDILKAHPDAKIIVLTNYDDSQFRRAAEEAGVLAFLPKEQLHRVWEILTP